MLKKTPLMEQYEKEHPGKHAIWNYQITEQFKIWKAMKEDPDFHPGYIYIGKDGFKITRKSWIAYYSSILKKLVTKYGLSKERNRKLLEEIAFKIYDYMARPNFRIGYPV